MTTFSPSPGDGLRITTKKGPHNYVVVGVSADGRDVVLASITSAKVGRNIDLSCPIHPGEHPLIYRESFVAYNYTKVRQVSAVQAMIDAGICELIDGFDAAIVERIIDGAPVSPHASDAVLKFIEDHC